MALSPARRADRRRSIVVAARALLRDRGDAGFSMAELAARAGVSPATPYNLVGSKRDILRLVVDEEFAAFAGKLAQVKRRSALQALLDATALVVTHYESDRTFYRALFGLVLNTEARDVHDAMQLKGRALWRGLVRAAVVSGELTPLVPVQQFTDVLLRTITIVTLGWLSEEWSHARFEREMSLSVRLICAAVARDDLRRRIIGAAL